VGERPAALDEHLGLPQRGHVADRVAARVQALHAAVHLGLSADQVVDMRFGGTDPIKMVDDEFKP